MSTVVFTLAERATAAYEASREKARQFINAKSTKEALVYTWNDDRFNWAAHFAQEVLQKMMKCHLSLEHHNEVLGISLSKNRCKISLCLFKRRQLDMDDLRSNQLVSKFVSIAHA